MMGNSFALEHANRTKLLYSRGRAARQRLGVSTPSGLEDRPATICRLPKPRIVRYNTCTFCPRNAGACMDLNDFGTQCESSSSSRHAAPENAFYHAERNFSPPDSPTAPIQWK